MSDQNRVASWNVQAQQLRDLIASIEARIERLELFMADPVLRVPGGSSARVVVE